MMKTYVTGTGKTIEIGLELGKGGEGSAYEVPADHHWVAKLYNEHHQPDALKQAKLRYMAAMADQELLSYAAWPQETLHETAHGPVVGFLMPKISGRVPIHMLYSPAHRRQEYPQAAWDFLLFAARNTAAAFDAIHQHGHVLGDVNQGNVLVGADSKVFLIDTDSFQINANGTIHLCKVGVAHFTPPELQGVASFDRVPRTSNHDNFGLALLIFHLLFGGRHPYSGKPLRDDA
jgi:DNA-binding helix-hairpin-helix protein with protein kinase domain